MEKVEAASARAWAWFPGEIRTVSNGQQNKGQTILCQIYHTRAMGNDAPSPHFFYTEFFDQVLDCMESPPGLKCSNLLVVFALEEESKSGRRCTWSGWGRRHAIKGRRREDWCTVNV
jgi:hypothetical protein